MRSKPLLLRPRHIAALLLPLLTVLLPAAAAEENGLHHGTVVEALNSGNYTYLRIEEGADTYWIATPHTMAPKGSSVTFHEQVWMYDFPSKMLHRTFDKVLFTADVVVESSPPPEPAGPKTTQHSAAKAIDAGAVTIAQIFARKSELSGKRVAVSGHVVKVLDRIMGSSWVHIEDDSEESGNHMVVRAPSHVADVGAEVNVSGILRVDVDYGYGYFYPVIIEDAEVSVVAPPAEAEAAPTPDSVR